MAHDSSGSIESKKRQLQPDETLDDSKKQRTEHDFGKFEDPMTDTNLCENHLKEIKRLKQELNQRDQEISSLNKIIVALTRKQGL